MSEYKALNNIAYDHLRDMIYNCELEFGKVYSETKLAAQISVSRTPVRDALNKLAHERYIDILPNKGFMLHTPSRADINEAYHVRRMIEDYCAGIVSADILTGTRRTRSAGWRKRCSSSTDCWKMMRPTVSAGSGWMIWHFTRRCWSI